MDTTPPRLPATDDHPHTGSVTARRGSGRGPDSEAARIIEAAPISAVVALLLETDPSGTWAVLEDEGELRAHLVDIVETGIAGEVVTIDAVALLLSAGMAVVS